MNTLYVFGCSISNNEQPTKENLKYVNYKGYEIDTWSDILSKRLNLNLKNFAISGASNQTIFEEVCKSASLFEKNDYVIINWTEIVRFRVSNENFWKELLPSYLSEDLEKLNPINKRISKQTISEIFIDRTNKLYCLELDNWYYIIKKLCDVIGVKLFFWSYPTFDSFYTIKCNGKNLFNFIKGKCGTIEDETNGIIKDGHFSELSHKLLAEFFYNYITESKN